MKEKWREELTSINDINFKKIKNVRAINYPIAFNDVFECTCDYQNEECECFIKVQRNEISGIENEINLLLELNKYIKEVPLVLEYGIVSNKYYLCTKKINGSKLSDLLRNQKNTNECLKYMYNYGKKLAQIHSLTLKCNESKKRKINNIPSEIENDSFFDMIISWLKKNEPIFDSNTFIHGDFYYGNILWDNYSICGIIDWEYSGYGFKEQDIAWALILRPCQTFLKTSKEQEEFLNGYKSIGAYDENKFKWCLVNGYAHFYKMEKDKNSEYAKKIIIIMNSLINTYIK